MNWGSSNFVDAVIGRRVGEGNDASWENFHEFRYMNWELVRCEFSEKCSLSSHVLGAVVSGTRDLNTLYFSYSRI